MRANAESLLRSNPHVCAKRGTEWQGAMFAVNNFAVNNFAVKNFQRRASKYWCELSTHLYKDKIGVIYFFPYNSITGHKYWKQRSICRRQA